MRTQRIAVIGGGVGGLVSAVELAARGLDVTLLERAASPGGKMREIPVGSNRIDSGPTVLTMRWVFDEVFESAGSSFESAVTLRPVDVLARHAWSAEERLDLYGDVERTAEAIADFSGADDARGYRRFSARAAAIYDTLEAPFLRSERPSTVGLARRLGPRRLGDLWRIRPFVSLWKALGDDFSDPRLRQLFGRYATYVGSSPFDAPATLMLIAHVERVGVWTVEDGMHRIAVALAELAVRLGAKLRFGVHVEEIASEGGRAAGVVLDTGERLDADAVVCNADTGALAAGSLGREASRAVPRQDRSRRSLSAITWSTVARAEGFPLVRHGVFFSRDYAAEFDDLFRRRRLPREPTVYVCAQDREGRDRIGEAEAERLFFLVNAPPVGDAGSWPTSEVERCEQRALGLLERCGLRVELRSEDTVVTTPREFDALFPETGGALYGATSHGWRASFRRPGCRSRMPGLYLAGGSVHPGPGVPMAALSGRLAAAAILEDLASTSRSPTTDTSGGTSTRSATTGATA